MLYFLHGNDTENIQKKTNSLVSSLLKKKPNASFFKINTDNFKESDFEELLFGQALFEQKYIVQVNFVFEDLEIQKYLLGKLKEISSSDNVFIFQEKKITKAILNKIEKHANKLQEFSKTENKGRLFATEKGDFNLSDFNIFDVTTALGKRDKRNLWVLYQKTKYRNIPTEEVSGLLFWQIKAMLQTSKAKNYQETDLKPFVFGKAKIYLKNYSEKELRKMGSDLISIYHQARRSGTPFELALERFILNI